MRLALPLFAAAAVVASLALPAQAQEGTADPLERDRTQPVTNDTYVRLCTGCHIAYPPNLQTADAWQAILARLPAHFGTEVPVPAERDGQDLAQYLRNFAGRPGLGVLTGVEPDAVPLRITELPFFAKAHAKVPDRAVQRAGGAWRCEACHPRAQEGSFERARAGGGQ